MSETVNEPALAERVGHYYEVDEPYLVGREKVREYAQAVQDSHPAHIDESVAAKLGYAGLVAPLTFTSIPAMRANRKLLESVLVGYETYVQTEQVFEQHRPIVVGDDLHADVEFASVRRVAGRDMFTITNTFADSAGETVHSMHTTVVGVDGNDIDPAMLESARRVMVHDAALAVAKGGSEYHRTVRVGDQRPVSTAGLTRTPQSLNFDDLAVGDTLPVRHVRVSRGDLVNYAGVAGDSNPIHWDESIAKLASLPDVIAHGMLTMGFGVGFVSAWSGDPGAVTKHTVRLSQPAIVPLEGADIEYTGRIKSLDPQTRSGVVIVFAKSGGRKIFGMATMEIRFR